jgi:hypothetical protein
MTNEYHEINQLVVSAVTETAILLTVVPRSGQPGMDETLRCETGGFLNGVVIATIDTKTLVHCEYSRSISSRFLCANRM